MESFIQNVSGPKPKATPLKLLGFTVVNRVQCSIPTPNDNTPPSDQEYPRSYTTIISKQEWFIIRGIGGAWYAGAVIAALGLSVGMNWGGVD